MSHPDSPDTEDMDMDIADELDRLAGDEDSVLVIDGGHVRSTVLDFRIVEFAIEAGAYRLDVLKGDAEVFHRAKQDQYRSVSELSGDDAEWLNELADEAVDRLNSREPIRWVWTACGSCLWATRVSV